MYTLSIYHHGNILANINNEIIKGTLDDILKKIESWLKNIDNNSVNNDNNNVKITICHEIIETYPVINRMLICDRSFKGYYTNYAIVDIDVNEQNIIKEYISSFKFTNMKEIVMKN